MSWIGDPRPCSPSAPGQPGMGDAAERMFHSHPIAVPLIFLVAGAALFALATSAGPFFGALAVLVALPGLIILPFGIRAAVHQHR